jgi:hypothetical protein
MKSYLPQFVCLCLSAATSSAQDNAPRHNFELAAGSVVPLAGYKATSFSPGPAFRSGYELRLIPHLAAEAGWTGSWLPGTSCSRYGCTHPREDMKFLDYGLRGIIPLAADRIELSAGLGGGYIWYDRGFESSFLNSALLQYSGKATLALDRRKRVRLGITFRTWRDLGRPTQQWLSATGGIAYGFGRLR